MTTRIYIPRDAAAVSVKLHELLDQAGLADSGVPAEHDYPRPPGRRLGELLAQRRQLRFPADEDRAQQTAGHEVEHATRAGDGGGLKQCGHRVPLYRRLWRALRTRRQASARRPIRACSSATSCSAIQ